MWEDHSLSGLSSNLGHIASELYLVMCLALLVLRKERLTHVVNELDDMIGTFLSSESHQLVRDSAESVMRIFRTVHNVFLVLCIVQTPLVMILPIIRFLYTGERKLLFVMKVWGPVSADEATPYPQLMAMAAVHSFILGTYMAEFGAINSIIFNILLGTRGCLHCVAARFRALREFHPQDHRLHDQLLRTFNMYQRVLTVCKEVNDIFRELFLIKVLSVLVTVCFAAFQIAKGLDNLAYFIVQLLLEGFNFFILCLVGNEIIEESAGVFNAMQEVPHVGTTKAFKRDMMMIMAHTAKPTFLRIGRYTAFSMSVFTSVIKTAYSWYTVLDGLG